MSEDRWYSLNSLLEQILAHQEQSLIDFTNVEISQKMAVFVECFHNLKFLTNIGIGKEVVQVLIYI